MHRFLATGMILLILLGLFVLGGFIATIVMVAVRASKLSSRVGDGKQSYFDGGAFAYVGWSILVALIDTCSLGFAYPWALCMFERWEKKHTVINGRRLHFDGKGIEIFGWNILWNFLSLITFGIFSIWRSFYIHKWTVKHTVYADGFGIAPSRFTGGGGAWFVHMLFVYLMTAFSFGFATPWAVKTYIKWQTANTEIGGSPLVFKGTGGQLFGRYILWMLLNAFTFGLFSLFMLVFFNDWRFFNTDALYATAGIQNAARAHETMAMRDFANIKIAAGQSVLELEKSGLTPDMSEEDISKLASQGNAIAKYRLALIKKGDAEVFEGEALELLKKSSDAGYHIAMYEYSALAQSEDEFLMLLDGSARRGSMQAVRKLRDFYTQRGYDPTLANSERVKNLSVALYWFKIAIELGDAEAIAMQQNYNGMTEMLSLLLCGEPQNRPSAKVSVATIVWTSILSVFLLLPYIILIVVMIVGGLLIGGKKSERPVEQNDYVYVFYGEGNLSVDIDDLYRYPSKDYEDYDFEHNFRSNDYINDDRISVNGYLGYDAYVDRDNGVTYIDFGISGDSVCYGGEFCVYLVSHAVDNNRGDGYAVLCGVVRPGEKITKINFALPEGMTDMNVMLLNSDVYNLQGTQTAIQAGNNGIFGSVTTNKPQDDKWVAQIYYTSINVKPYSESVEDTESSEDINEEVPLEEAIVGHWVSAVRTDNLIYTTYYSFNSDGTFEMGGCEYMHTSYMPDMFIGMPEGWQVVPMGYPYTSGTYTVENDIIKLQGQGMGEGDVWEYNNILTVKSIESEFLTTLEESDLEHRYYKCSANTEIEEICNALGLPTAP